MSQTQGNSVSVSEVSAQRTGQVEPAKLVAAMEQELRQYLQDVMQAVNAAPDGAWLAGSEERVRELSAEFRRRTFEQAVQLRIDAAEAAFSPSAEPAVGPATS